MGLLPVLLRNSPSDDDVELEVIGECNAITLYFYVGSVYVTYLATKSYDRFNRQENKRSRWPRRYAALPARLRFLDILTLIFDRLI